MKTSDDCGEIGKALLAAKKKFRQLAKTHTATVQGGRQHGYADMAETLDSIDDSLEEAGVLLTQSPGVDGANVSVCTRFFHPASGQWMETEGVSLHAGSSSAHAIGSALTYARRYDLQIALGLAPHDDDDDGAAAQSAYDQSRQKAAGGNRQQPVNQSTRNQQPANRPVAPKPKSESPQSPPSGVNSDRVIDVSAEKTVAGAADTAKVMQQLATANCRTLVEQNLVLNWLTNNSFAGSNAVQAIAQPAAAASVLNRMREEFRSGLKHESWLEFAKAWQQAEAGAQPAN